MGYNKRKFEYDAFKKRGKTSSLLKISAVEFRQSSHSCLVIFLKWNMKWSCFDVLIFKLTSFYSGCTAVVHFVASDPFVIAQSHWGLLASNFKTAAVDCCPRYNKQQS